MVKEKHSPTGDTSEILNEIKDLILFNDEVNTFDFVIETLIDVCGHDPVQAEQCTLIAHFKGKCVVKTAPFEELEPIFTEMSNRDLTVAID